MIFHHRFFLKTCSILMYSGYMSTNPTMRRVFTGHFVSIKDQNLLRVAAPTGNWLNEWIGTTNECPPDETVVNKNVCLECMGVLQVHLLWYFFNMCTTLFLWVSWSRKWFWKCQGISLKRNLCTALWSSHFQGVQSYSVASGEANVVTQHPSDLLFRTFACSRSNNCMTNQFTRIVFGGGFKQRILHWEAFGLGNQGKTKRSAAFSTRRIKPPGHWSVGAEAMEIAFAQKGCLDSKGEEVKLKEMPKEVGGKSRFFFEELFDHWKEMSLEPCRFG